MGPSKRALRRRSGFALALGALFAVAVTATALSAVTGLQQFRVTDPDVPDSNDHKVAGAPCPAGKRVVGAGGAATGSPGQHAITALVPDAAGQELRQVNAVADEDQAGDDARWSLTAVAICADPLPGLTRESGRSPTDSDNKSAVARCPAGLQVVGVGGDITGGKGEVRMQSINPHVDKGGATVFAAEDRDGTDAPWTVRARAICATP
jgi:hypothetical protein